MTSQSLPSPVFGVAALYPPEVKFDAFGTSKHGKENLYRKKIFATLSAHWGDLLEQIKKSVIYTLTVLPKYTAQYKAPGLPQTQGQAN